jgi:hypothetical protein
LTVYFGAAAPPPTLIVGGEEVGAFFLYHLILHFILKIINYLENKLFVKFISRIYKERYIIEQEYKQRNKKRRNVKATRSTHIPNFVRLHIRP